MTLELDTVRQEGSRLAHEIEALAVTDQDSFELAALYRGQLIGYEKKVLALCGPTIKATDLAHKEAVAMKNTLLAVAVPAKVLLGERMAIYEQDQKRIRREAEAAFERARRAAEEETRLAMALDAERRGEREKAERILTAPTPPVAVFTPPVVLPAAPRAEGVSFRDQWDFAVDDLDLVPREYLILDEAKIRKLVQALKDEFAVPGLRAVHNRVTVQRH